MIALFSAVEQENAWLRSQLVHPLTHRLGPFPLQQGQLAGHEVIIVTTGIGKAAAAAAAALVLNHWQPRWVIAVGCGGLYPGHALAIGDLVLASEEIYADEGVQTPGGFLDMEQIGLPLLRRGDLAFYNRFPVDAERTRSLKNALETAHSTYSSLSLASGPFVTVSTCHGTDQGGRQTATRTGGLCENMEGAAIAQLCCAWNTSFSELRALSNRVENRDLSQWDLEGAMHNAQRALFSALDNLPASIASPAQG
ncbi:MAG: futalosine hydrolase [Desulfuromonadaceae bacterium]|nr:futalosine hydrolase [Desulfuromonadaceae bacterium]